jgi:hypothetical protein
MGNKIAAFVDDCDVHRLADFRRFLFGGCDNFAASFSVTIHLLYA